MSGVLGGSKAPVYPGNLQLNSSAYGLPVPLQYGQARTGVNLGYYNNFQTIANKSSGAGKGGSTGSTSYTYTADVLFLVGEGQISGFGTVWSGQSTETQASLGLYYNSGGFGQEVWPHLAGTQQAVPYSGMSYIAGAAFNLGSSATLPNINIEVFGLCYQTSANPNAGDADPADVVVDIVSNPAHGAGLTAKQVGTPEINAETYTVPSSAPYQITVANASTYDQGKSVTKAGALMNSVVMGMSPLTGQYVTFRNGVYQFSAADAGASVTINYSSVSPVLQSFSDFTQASGLWVSPTYTSQQAASSMIDSLVTNCYSEVVWSAGVMTVVPRGTVSVSGNGRSWTAPTAPLFSLTDDDFLPNVNAGNADDPIQVTRSRVSDQDNDIKLECTDRLNSYATTVVEATDDGLLTRYGRRTSSRTAHEFADMNAAMISAQLQLQDEYIRNNYSFTLDARYCLLDPMDVVAVTDAEMGIYQQWVRITNIQEQTDGSILFTAEEYPTGTGAAALYSIDPRSGYAPNQSASAATVLNTAIFCPPVAMCASNGIEVWAAACSDNNASWGGCNIWVSYDNANYTLAGTLDGASRMGVLTATLPVGSDPDKVNSIAVDMSESGGTLTGGSQVNADQMATACWINGEIVSYESATLTGAHQYSLGTYLRRGAYGSGINAHAVGAQFVRLDNQLVKIPVNGAQVGVTVYLKFQSFNQYGGALQSLASLIPISVNINTAPNAFTCTGLTATPNFGNVALSWVNPALANHALAAVAVMRSTTNTLSTATQVGLVAYPGQGYIDTTVVGGTSYYYWVVPIDIAGTWGVYSPSVSVTAVTSLPSGVTVGPTNLAPGLTATAVVNMSTAAVAALTSEVAGMPVLYNQGDYTTYRWNGSGYTAVVSASLINGTISLSAIPQIPTSQLTGSISANMLVANSIGAGQIAASYVYAGAIAASQVTAGTFTGFTIQTAGGVGSGSAGVLITAGNSGGIAGYNANGQLVFTLNPTGTAFGMEIVNNGGQFNAAGANYTASAYGSVPGFLSTGNSTGSYAFVATTGGLRIQDSSPIAMGGGSITGVGSITTSGAASVGGNLSVTGSISIGASSGNIIADNGNSILSVSGGTLFLGNGTYPNVSNNHFYPGSSSWNLGTTGNGRWAAVYSVTGTIQTSDGTQKDEVDGAGLGLDFISALRPMAGRWKGDPTGEVHQWLIAQEVEKALDGRSFAGLIRPVDEDDHYSLNYSEFIPPIIKAIQELADRIGVVEGAIRRPKLRRKIDAAIRPPAKAA